jgi:nicotinamide-nucleotide amidase
MKAEIIAIGSELLSPWRMDTNSLFITEQLNRIGARVWRKTIVGDRLEDLEEVMRQALSCAEIVICIGGLGPTRDDLTREAVSSVLGRPLELNQAALEQVQARFARLGVPMTPNNRQQAMVPAGATVLPNPNGTAPGLFLQQEDRLMFLLPGPPRELEPMVANHLVGAIAQLRQTSSLIFRQLKIASEGESRVDHLVAPIYQSYADVETTILASAGIVDLYFYWTGPPDRLLAAQTLEELTARVKEALGLSVYAESDESLESVVGAMLREQGKTLATAESCTGGLIAKMITDVPGSSAYFRGGMVAYSNHLKEGWLRVSPELLARFGAVSPEIAETMALSVRERARADYGISATGVAGPDGGTAEKPVGLVYLGLADQNGAEVRKLQLLGDRKIVRLRTARTALDWLRRKMS